MMRSRYKILIFLSLVFLVPSVSGAQVVISEIMYDLDGSDSGREWLEIFNAGGSSVVLSEMRLFEADTNHKISSVQGGDSLASGKYAIVADNASKFLLDNPGFSGALFDSSFSLSNSGETLKIRSSDLLDLDSVSYFPDSGAAGDGNALHRSSVNSTSFSVAAPTPGTGSLSVNSSGTEVKTEPIGDSSINTENQTKDNSNKSYSLNFPVEPQIYAYAGKDRTVIVGADVAVEGLAFNKEGESLDGVRFIWNFGDGATNEGESVMHHWNYPGRYVMVLDIAQQKNAASDSVVITAEPAKIELSMLDDGGLVIANNAGRTLDLSGWHLKMGGRVFKIPENSLFLSGERVAFSTDITGLSIINHPAQLLYPNGEVAVTEGAEEASPSTTQNVLHKQASGEIREVSQSPIIGSLSIGAASGDSSPKEPVVAQNVSQEPHLEMDNQLAAAANSGSTGGLYWLFGVFGLVSLGAFSAVTARRSFKRTWDIVEEEA